MDVLSVAEAQAAAGIQARGWELVAPRAGKFKARKAGFSERAASYSDLFDRVLLREKLMFEDALQAFGWYAVRTGDRAQRFAASNGKVMQSGATPEQVVETVARYEADRANRKD